VGQLQVEAKLAVEVIKVKRLVVVMANQEEISKEAKLPLVDVFLKEVFIICM
jgi:hypothetical protein